MQITRLLATFMFVALNTTNAQNLTASWPFNQGSTVDVSLHGYNGTGQSVTAVPDRSGDANSALQFNGSSSGVEITNTFPMRSQQTVIAWIKPASFTVIQPIVEKAVAGFGGEVDFDFFLRGAIVHWEVNTDNGATGIIATAIASAALTVGQWSCVAGVIDQTNDQVRLYISGELQSTGSMGRRVVRNLNRPFRIGKRVGQQSPRSLNGVIDDVRIYDRALSDLEISQLYILDGGLPVAPSITTSPQNQSITSGGSVTFTVSATGVPIPTYQWRRNGVNIPGTSSPSFPLTNVQLAQAGSYTVVATNSVGQVTSAPAKLTVLSNLDIFAPGLTPYGFPQAPAGTDSLVLITHGRVDPNESQNSPSSAWIETMKSKIQSVVPANWAVLAYHWEYDSTTSTVQVFDGELLGRATLHGSRVGNAILLQGLSRPGGKWQHIHFIAHSAGSALIETASRIVKPSVSQNAPTIHTTFLDPFTGTSDGNRARYGANSNWSDNYFSFSPDTWDQFNHRTFGPMAHAHNVEVTCLDPNAGSQNFGNYLASQYSQNSTPATLVPVYVKTSTHGWPIEFYQNTILPISANQPPGYAGYGFPLSKEGGGTASDASHPRPNSPIPSLGSSSGQTGTSYGTTAVNVGSASDFSTLPYALGQTGTVQINTMGFTAITSAPAPSPTPPEQVKTSTQFAVAAASPPVGAPAWISIPVEVTGNVSFVTFNAGFTSQPGASGLLTVYWNDVEIGRIEEQVSLPGVQSYTFDIPSAFRDRNNSLGFRLDQFSSVVSSIGVTNVATGFGGLPTAPKVKIESVPGVPTPVLTVTGTQNFTYLVQTSQDLMNWEPMAAVTLDTGVNAALTDPETTSLQLRFYRVVSP